MIIELSTSHHVLPVNHASTSDIGYIRYDIPRYDSLPFTGKSTLLSALSGKLSPKDGSRIEGDGLELGVFTQDLAQDLVSEKLKKCRVSPWDSLYRFHL